MIPVPSASTIWLEIPQTIQSDSWQRCESLIVPGNRWQTHLNQVCLQTLLPWLQEKSGSQPMVDPICGLALWELVNGSAVSLENLRIVLIPLEAMGTQELIVPQEWVDHPEWVGDYYFAIEVDADESMLHIWGYTTHAQLKAQAQYDPIVRTYHLDGDDVMQDMNVFWVMQQLRTETTRSPVTALPTLLLDPAQLLIQRLGNPITVAIPRLEVPFLEWAALLTQASWVKELGQQRLGQQTQTPSPSAQATSVLDTILDKSNLSVSETGTIANLGQWLQNIFETGWQSLEMLVGNQSEFTYAFRREEPEAGWLQRVKQLACGNDQAILLLVRIRAESDGRINVWIQALPTLDVDYLPAQLQLSALTLTGDVIDTISSGNESRYLQLRRFKSIPGNRFRIQMTFNDGIVTEDFTT